MTNMSKNNLLTLKDLEVARKYIMSKEELVVSVAYLKQEAIKWVKYYDKKEEDDYVNVICNWIEDFFNITESDLYPKGHETELEGGKSGQNDNK